MNFISKNSPQNFLLLTPKAGPKNTPFHQIKAKENNEEEKKTKKKQFHLLFFSAATWFWLVYIGKIFLVFFLLFCFGWFFFPGFFKYMEIICGRHFKKLEIVLKHCRLQVHKKYIGKK